MQKNILLSSYFRGMLPVVVDIETSGLKPGTDALLEIAIVFIEIDDKGLLRPGECLAHHIEPFHGARLDPESLAIHGINLESGLRYPIPEQQALHLTFNAIRAALTKHQCQRAVLVGHNAWFDLAFLNAAIERCQIKAYPFHSFTTLDTASLASVMLGENVLARAAKAARISFDVTAAHSAIYDAKKTAELFCYLVNKTKRLDF